MYYNKKVFVVVDAYTTGRFIAPLINANGYLCVHIKSNKNIIPAYRPSFIESNFIQNLIFEGDIEPIKEYLKQFDVLGVIPGTETGVMFADLISQTLGLKTSNSVALSSARRNKYEMVSCLKKQQLPHAKSFMSKHLDEIVQWVRENEVFPVVVKPLSSAGSDGVKICHDIDEVKSAFHAILNSHDMFNDLNTKVMVQQFLAGQEYIVNTVSYAGKHKIVDIWRKFKNKLDGIPINDFAEIVAPSEENYTELSKYVFQVLDALEIQFGAGHSEIMLTDRGPILIETAARLEGSIDPSAVHEATGSNHVASLVQSYINPDKFLESASKTNSIKKYARHVFLVSPFAGEVKKQPDLKKIMDLPSFHSFSFRYEQGHKLLKTTSLVDFPGFVYFVSEDKKQVEQDYKTLRQFEKTLYSNICLS